MSRRITGPIVACVLVALACTGCAAEVIIRTPPPTHHDQGAAPGADHLSGLTERAPRAARRS